MKSTSNTARPLEVAPLSKRAPASAPLSARRQKAAANDAAPESPRLAIEDEKPAPTPYLIPRIGITPARAEALANVAYDLNDVGESIAKAADDAVVIHEEYGMQIVLFERGDGAGDVHVFMAIPTEVNDPKFPRGPHLVRDAERFIGSVRDGVFVDHVALAEAEYGTYCKRQAPGSVGRRVLDASKGGAA